MSGVIETFIVNKIPENTVVMIRGYDNKTDKLESIICDDGILYEFTDLKDKIIANRLKEEWFLTLLKRFGIYEKYIESKKIDNLL